MDNKQQHVYSQSQNVSRRWFFHDCSIGLAGMALNSLAWEESRSEGVVDPYALGRPHFAPRVKRVVFMFQAGAPSQLELFDPKPELAKHDGTLPPAGLLENYRSAFIDPNSKLMGPRFSFKPRGECGMLLGELIPEIGSIADELCVVRTVHTDAVNHAPAQIFMNTGSQQFGRPSFGSWTLYGLGSESKNLPGFVVLNSGRGTSGGASNYSSGFLPSSFSGVPFRGSGDPILYLSNPPGFDDQAQRHSLDSIRQLNSIEHAEMLDPEIMSRIQSYESAYRLQTAAPELMALETESQETLNLYGIKDVKESSYAKNCLLARRLLERGVRFVQLFHEAWYQHLDLKKEITKNCQHTDRASAALVKDLKQRGLLEDTLVIWGGEFGRTPMVQGDPQKADGRDHHNRCFTMWLAGGGVKNGYVHGATDELGFNIARDPVHVHDLNATFMHLLGIDHTKLTYRFQGRDFRLTDVHGEVVHEILA